MERCFALHWDGTDKSLICQIPFTGKNRNLFGPYWTSRTEVHPVKLNQPYSPLSPRPLCNLSHTAKMHFVHWGTGSTQRHCTSPYFIAASKQSHWLRGDDYYFNHYLIISWTSIPGTKFISPRGFSLIKIPQLPKHVLSIFGGNQNVVHDWNSDAIEHSMTSPPTYPRPCYFLSPWQLFGPEPCPDNDDFPTTQPRPLTNARFCLRAML